MVYEMNHMLQLSLTESAEALQTQGPPTLPADDSSAVRQPSFGDLSNSSGLIQSFTPPPCQSTPRQALGDEKTGQTNHSRTASKLRHPTPSCRRNDAGNPTERQASPSGSRAVAAAIYQRRTLNIQLRGQLW